MLFSEQKKVDKQVRKVAIENNFKAIVLEWHEYKLPGWSKGYVKWNTKSGHLNRGDIIAS